MFGFNSKAYKAQQLQLINKELQVYKEAEQLKITSSFVASERELHTNLEKLALACAKQIGEYEHTFHSTKEHLGIEIAKLEARKENLELELNKYNVQKESMQALLDYKDNEVENLKSIIDKLISSKQELQVLKVK